MLDALLHIRATVLQAVLKAYLILGGGDADGGVPGPPEQNGPVAGMMDDTGQKG